MSIRDQRLKISLKNVHYSTYAYTIHQNHVEKPRLTDWKPSENASNLKKFAAKYQGGIVMLKSKLLGSGTAKNQ
jgi:hypothetical protein